MIRFQRHDWYATFYWYGGINRHLFHPCAIYCIFVAAMYTLQSHFELQITFDKVGLHVIETLTVFLLVFRINQSMARHNEGTQATMELFVHLENIIGTCCNSLAGARINCMDEGLYGKHPPTEVHLQVRHAEFATATKVHCIRLTLALAVSFLLHCRLCEATSDDAGELTEQSLQHVIFLHSRLQCLLYTEEMRVIDQAICVICEKTKGGYLFRAEVSRFHPRDEDTAFLFPSQGQEDDDVRHPHGSTVTRSVVPLPKIVMNFLVDLLNQPLCNVWGYPERVMNLLHTTCGETMSHIGNLVALISQPIPLAYIQHCRVLLLSYAVLNPLGVDLEGGWVDNVVLPVAVFWGLYGLQVLANMMENPIGGDDTDINLMEYLHMLECAAQSCFDQSEIDRHEIRAAWKRILPGIAAGEKENQTYVEPIVDHRSTAATRNKRNFQAYFSWMPIPTLLLQDLLENHGQVEMAHETAMVSGRTGIRTMLRRALRRLHRGHAHVYESVKEDNIGLSLTLKHDPNFYCHYLSFNGVIHPDHLEQQSHASWKKHVLGYLDGHDAASLLSVKDHQDTERSILGPMPQQSDSERESDPDPDAQKMPLLWCTKTATRRHAMRITGKAAMLEIGIAGEGGVGIAGEGGVSRVQSGVQVVPQMAPESQSQNTPQAVQNPVQQPVPLSSARLQPPPQPSSRVVPIAPSAELPTGLDRSSVRKRSEGRMTLAIQSSPSAAEGGSPPSNSALSASGAFALLESDTRCETSSPSAAAAFIRAASETEAQTVDRIAEAFGEAITAAAALESQTVGEAIMAAKGLEASTVGEAITAAAALEAQTVDRIATVIIADAKRIDEAITAVAALEVSPQVQQDLLLQPSEASCDKAA